MKENRQLVIRQHGGCLSLDVVVKPHIPVTLICVDTVKPHLAEKVIDWCLDQATFADVKLLTDKPGFKHAVKIDPVNGIEAYSNFIVKELHKYVATSHCLIVQTDGYMLNAHAWRPLFLSFDYIGSPWYSIHTGAQSSLLNGGFSLRSKKLLDATARNNFGDSPHPEDLYITVKHRKTFENLGIRYSPAEVASSFSMESRTWNGEDWYSDGRQWRGEFGFHCFLTNISQSEYRPLIFHHSGDAGDVIYSLPVIKSLGGGVLYLSSHCRYPYPRAPHAISNHEWANNIGCLANRNDYIWRCQHTPVYPHSTDCDLNEFRKFFKTSGPHNFQNLFDLHLKAFGISYPANEPWLTINDPITIDGRPICINRTLRYRNGSFDWLRYIREYGNQMVFVGSAEEYGIFCGEHQTNSVLYKPTGTLLDVARIIAGAKMFIGNQSCPLAIAHGLCKRVIVECWPVNPNCSLRRDGAIYGLTHTPEIPKDWIQ